MLAEAFKTDAIFELSDVSKSSSENRLLPVPGGGLTEFLCMWAKELCTWQKVTWSECSSLEKLGPLQKQLTSLGGNSQWRGDKVCNCSRD